MNSRLLGTSEHIWYRLGQLSSNNFTMVALLSGELEESQLRYALNNTVKSQVMLRSKVEEANKKLYFNVKELCNVDLKVINRKSEDHWKELVEEELKSELLVECFPLWRFTWVKGEGEHELLMTFNHLLSDGKSGLNFYRKLLTLVDKPDGKNTKNTLFPSYEKQLEKTHGFFSSIKHKLSAFNEYRKNKRREWFQLRACHDQKGSTAIESRIICPQSLQTILNACQENDVTLSTYLSSLMSITFSENTSKNNSLSLAVDMRPYLKNDLQEDIGYFVTSVDLVKEKDFKGDTWQLAKVFKQRLNSQLNHSQFKFDTLMRSLAIKAGKDNHSFRDLIQNALNNSMLLTNIGKVDIKSEYQKFKLKHCFHVPSVHLMGLPFICLAVSTLNDEMILNFSYTDSFISEKRMKALIDEFIEAL